MNRSGEQVVIGWRVIDDQKTAHYFISLHGYSTAGSKCLNHFVHINRLKDAVSEHCSLCEVMLKILPERGGDLDKE